MAEFLETTFEKLIFKVKVGYLYSKEDFWADIRGNVATVGLADFLQKSKGDVAFLETVEPGTPVKKGQELGKIETIKATVGIISPVNGKVIEINPELEDSPHLINSDPYEAGWIYKIELTDPEGDKGKLLEAESYMKLMREKIEKEGKKLYG
ncbi:MAG: glycine cleavage system protein GcvH [Dehalococcoidia bacterium]|nr:glycine cleavage system protein GcvH [Dehalococcoidia bacterium]